VAEAIQYRSLDKPRRQFARLDHGPKGHIYTLYQDSDEPSKLLWIGASDGLYVYDKAGDSSSHYRNDFGSPNRPEDNRDPFSQYNNDLGNPNRPEDNDVRTVYRDRKGRLWVGMLGEDLDGGCGRLPGLIVQDGDLPVTRVVFSGMQGEMWLGHGQSLRTGRGR